MTSRCRRQGGRGTVLRPYLLQELRCHVRSSWTSHLSILSALSNRRRKVCTLLFVQTSLFPPKCRLGVGSWDCACIDTSEISPQAVQGLKASWKPR